MEVQRSRDIYSEDGPFLVSVIVRAGADGAALERHIDELKRQTLFAGGRMQIWVVASGGAEAEKIAERFRAGGMGDSKRLQMVQGRAGETAAEARNRAIKASRSAFLVFADAGERLAPDALEKMAGVLEAREEAAVVYADRDVAGDAADFSRGWLFEGEGFEGPVMWRRRLHQRLGFFDADLWFASAYEFWLRVSSRHSFSWLPELLGRRETGGAELSDAEGDLRAREMNAARERYWKSEWGEHPNVRRAEKCFAALRRRLGEMPAGTRVALFGAGKHTARMMEKFREAIEPRHGLVGILDDRAAEGQAVDGLEVIQTGRWREAGVRAVVVSSDAFERTMASAVKRTTGGAVPIFCVYGNGAGGREMMRAIPGATEMAGTVS